MYYQHGHVFQAHANIVIHPPEYPLHSTEQASPELWLDGNEGSDQGPSVADFKTDVSPVMSYLNTTTTTSSATFPSSLPSYLQCPSPMQASSSHNRRPLAGDGSVRRVYSTGDLDVQRMGMSSFHFGQRSESPLGAENGGVDQIAPKAGRYSAEEKKERIERYRSKRNQRNFNKKIKYACRKTLADSRPRVRGRFARNDEAGETSSGCSWISAGGEEEEEEVEDWLNFIDAFATI